MQQLQGSKLSWTLVQCWVEDFQFRVLLSEGSVLPWKGVGLKSSCLAVTLWECC